jgi:hypothetical protein
MQTPEEVAAMLRLKALSWSVRRIAGELGCSHTTATSPLAAAAASGSSKTRMAAYVILRRTSQKLMPGTSCCTWWNLPQGGFGLKSTDRQIAKVEVPSPQIPGRISKVERTLRIIFGAKP